MKVECLNIDFSDKHLLFLNEKIEDVRVNGKAMNNHYKIGNYFYKKALSFQKPYERKRKKVKEEDWEDFINKTHHYDLIEYFLLAYVAYSKTEPYGSVEEAKEKMDEIENILIADFRSELWGYDETKGNEWKREHKDEILKEQKVDKINNLILIIIFAIIFGPFYLIWFVLMKWPSPKYGEQKLLGLFRLASWFFVICLLQNDHSNLFGVSYGREIDTFLNNLFPSWLATATFAIGGIFAVYHFIKALFLLGGYVNGASYISRSSNTSSNSSGFSNIDEALEFREGILGMQSTKGKMEELSKTAFMTKSNFNNLAEDPNTREGLEYLDGMLGMQSTRGKYEYLKNMISGRK